MDVRTATMATASSPLNHRTIYESHSDITLNLPLIDDLRIYHSEGSFPLVEDPRETKRSLFIGMFVLRPMTDAWTATTLDEAGEPTSMYSVANGWSYNMEGLEGGWLIAGGNHVDAYRLGFQYGVSDAVMVGSKVICDEGCDPIPPADLSACKRGFLWQPYGPLSWSHIQSADSNLIAKVDAQRQEWQRLELLSNRKYPAQIVVTWSGDKHNSSRDFLEGRIFKEVHPNGDPFEVYIVTSVNGANKIRSRAYLYGLEARIEDILIVLSPQDLPDEIDLKILPELLYHKYDMRVINHDGGQGVLRKFAQAKILPQLNLSLMRKRSLKDIITTSEMLSPEQRSYGLSNFPNKVQNFFHSTSDGSIPSALKPVSVISDSGDNIAIVTFSAISVDDL